MRKTLVLVFALLLLPLPAAGGSEGSGALIPPERGLSEPGGMPAGEKALPQQQHPLDSQRIFADTLWEEGRRDFRERRYDDALCHFRESVTVFPHPGRQRYTHEFSLRVKQNTEQARHLREEGLSLQQRGDLTAASTYYRSSLKYWPDKALEAHAGFLEHRMQARTTSRAPENPLDPAICDVVDTSAVFPPGDFVLTLTFNPPKSSPGGRRVTQIFASGEVIERTLVFDPAYDGTLGEREKQDLSGAYVSREVVRRLYATVVACRFFSLEMEYINRDVKDGWSQTLEVTAGGRTHTSTVYHYDVPRISSIVSAIRSACSTGR